jgi:amino acid transporter
LSIFVIGLIVPSNDPAIATNAGNAKTSPFAIAAQRAGVKALPSIINAVILTSAWSSGNHGMLTGSRSLYAMALEGRAPRIFARVSRFGIPWVAVTFQGMFQFLAFMSLGSGGASEAFEWLTNINSANTLIIWIVIGICSWRMRKAMKAQGISPERLPYKFPFQPILAQITIWGSSLILITGGFYVFVSLPIVTYDPEP